MFRVVLWSGGHLSLPLPLGHHGRCLDAPHDAPQQCQSVIFWQFVEKLDSGSSSQKKIFGFLYLFLKLSLTLPHKEKLLWCSYFRSYIKSINFSRNGFFVKKFNFVSTPWKIIIPLGNSVGTMYRLYKTIWVGNDFSFCVKVSSFDNLVKKLTAGGVLR